MLVRNRPLPSSDTVCFGTALPSVHVVHENSRMVAKNDEESPFQLDVQVAASTVL